MSMNEERANEWAQKAPVEMTEDFMKNHGHGSLIAANQIQQRNPTVRESLQMRYDEAAQRMEQAHAALKALPDDILSMDVYAFYRLIGV